MHMDTITVYHTGFSEIRTPDLTVGRRNADFGQGFYLSDDAAFAGRWSGERKGASCYVNTYSLALSDLNIKRLSMDEAWYDYITANRASRADTLAGYDVVIGPIACDTIYNTYGILTSGVFDKALVLDAYRLGPDYTQIVLKRQRAVSALRFVSSRVIPTKTVAENRAFLNAEEQAYMEKLTKLLEADPS